LAIAPQIDGAHFDADTFGDQLCDVVQPLLPITVFCQRVAQPREQLPTV
jgi:hypothetical protein